jgi:hypothetical protein
MSNKFQNEDFKSESELVSAGGTKANLLNATKIYSPKTTNVLETDLRKNNDSAITAPSVGNDVTQGYEAGSRWIDTVAQKTYFCISNSTGAAIWKESGSGGGVGGVDIIHVQTAEDAALADFTQNGLEIIASPIILHGLKSFRLIHQAASTRDFKDIISVDRKFRGKNVTFELDIVSSAEASNLTILFRDETPGLEADIVPSQSITTEAQSITATVASGSPTLNGMDVATFNKLRLGMLITGPGIPSGTRIDGLTPATLSATMSQNATTSNSSTKKISSLTTKRKFTFNLKDSCTQFSYKISALQEANFPESYVDDIIVQLTEYAKTTASITVPTVEIVQSSSLNQTTSIGTATITGALATNSNTGIFSYDPVTGIYTVSKNSKFNISASVRSSGAAASLPVIVVNGADTSASSTSPLASYWNSVSWSGDLLAGQTFFVKNAGNPCDIQRVYVSARTNPSTETKTIPLSSSVIVTEPDSYLQMNGFSVAAGSVGTKILTLASPTYLKNEGSAFRYVKDSVNGDYVEALLDGQYSFSFNFDSTATSTTNYTLGFSKNSTQLTTDYTGINPENQLGMTYTQDAPHLTWSGVLKSGDKIRIHSVSNGHLTSQGLVYSQFSVSYVGSTKIINPSTDQKVEIPTHELRFEGASARGSVATAIVKFDTLARIKGDGFEVINTAADGTYVRIKKAGKLDVSVTLYFGSFSAFAITRNQTLLTNIPSTSSEYLSGDGVQGNNEYGSASWSGEVKVGDIIRVASQVNPANTSSINFNLLLQETSVAVALQNVAPRWDNSDTSVRISRSNGETISAGTDNIRFSSLDNVIGTSAYFNTNGFITTESGIFTLNAIVLCTTSATRGVDVYVNGTFYKRATDSISSDTFNVNFTDYFPANSYITLRFAGSGATLSTANSGHWFTISKVGKTQGTVDVTPFVQIPQNEVEAIEALTTTSTFGSTNTGVPVLNITKNTNKGIIQVLSSAAEGTSFKVLKDCTIDVSATALAGSGAIMITRNSNILTTAFPTGFFLAGQHMFAGPVFGNLDTTISCSVGDIIRIQRQDNVSTSILSVILTATALSPSIATPTEQVSSDTIPFVFKATAITDSDPVGTFNTFSYLTSGSVAVTINTTPPTQSTSDMNINGVRLYSRAMNTTSGSATPARFDIKVGKGLKSKEVLAYANAAKSAALRYSGNFNGSNVEDYDTTVIYDETTGVLILTAGISGSTNNTRAVGLDASRNAYPNGYFVFNASKSPSLVSIPNLQQRVAYLSDVKPSGTTGGTSISGAQTRTLNILVDPTGFVTSLASNQFTLPAGTYEIYATAPAYRSQRHKARVRSITDGGATVLSGSSEYAFNADTTQSISTISGVFTITTSKTFDIQHTFEVGSALGLGVNSSFGDAEVFTQVKITKIK